MNSAKAMVPHIIAITIIATISLATRADPQPSAVKRALNSLLQIELQLRGSDGDILDTKLGHGIVLAREGIAITAAHVVIPPCQWLDTAAFLTIEIFRWNNLKNIWTSIEIFSGEELAATMVHSDYIDIEKRRTVKCRMDTLVSPRHDFAFLHLGYSRVVERMPKYSFVETVQPFFPARDLEDYHNNLFFLSTFPLTKGQIHAWNTTKPEIRHVSWTGGLVFRGPRFIPGHSGSPILIYSPEDACYFLVGVASETQGEDSLEISTLKSILHHKASEVNPYLRRDELFDCENSALPYDNSLLVQYHILTKHPPLPLKSREPYISCFKHETWEHLIGLLRNEAAFRASILAQQPVAGDDSITVVDSVSFEPRKPSEAHIIELGRTRMKLTVRNDQELAEALEAVYQDGLDPIPVMTMGSDEPLEPSAKGIYEYKTLGGGVARSIQFTRERPNKMRSLQTAASIELGRQIMKPFCGFGLDAFGHAASPKDHAGDSIGLAQEQDRYIRNRLRKSNAKGDTAISLVRDEFLRLQLLRPNSDEKPQLEELLATLSELNDSKSDTAQICRLAATRFGATIVQNEDYFAEGVATDYDNPTN